MIMLIKSTNQLQNNVQAAHVYILILLLIIIME